MKGEKMASEIKIPDIETEGMVITIHWKGGDGHINKHLFEINPNSPAKTNHLCNNNAENYDIDFALIKAACALNAYVLALPPDFGDDTQGIRDLKRIIASASLLLESETWDETYSEYLKPYFSENAEPAINQAKQMLHGFNIEI